jgi:hypothetical protein
MAMSSQEERGEERLSGDACAIEDCKVWYLGSYNLRKA